jgi:hypothetical protein
VSWAEEEEEEGEGDEEMSDVLLCLVPSYLLHPISAYAPSPTLSWNLSTTIDKHTISNEVCRLCLADSRYDGAVFVDVRR